MGARYRDIVAFCTAPSVFFCLLLVPEPHIRGPVLLHLAHLNIANERDPGDYLREYRWGGAKSLANV